MTTHVHLATVFYRRFITALRIVILSVKLPEGTCKIYDSLSFEARYFLGEVRIEIPELCDKT